MIAQDRGNYFKTIGQNLKALRLEHGLTQKNIADLLGVSFQQVQKYETGQNKLPIENLLHLKNYYDISFDAFFSGIKGFKAKTNTDYALYERQILARLSALEDLREKRKLLNAIQILIS